MKPKIPQKFKKINRVQKIILLIFLSMLLITGYQIFITYKIFFARQNQARADIQNWMTIPFIAHRHQIEPKILYDAIELPPEKHDRRTLNNIARTQKTSVEELILKLQDTIANEKPVDPNSNQGDNKNE